MLRFLFRFLSLPPVLVLTAFTLRRALFTLALFFVPRRPAPRLPADLPTVLVLVACRDEAPLIPGLARALAALDYPAPRLHVILIDDGSHDATRAAMELTVRAHPNWHVLPLDTNHGKARALNAARARFPVGEIIYVFDADHRPAPGALRRAVAYFADPSVAGVSGRTVPSNALATPAAYYSTVESYVHQMLTMRAKDRLALAPALLGSNCGYRRAALDAVGGFQPGALLEDSDLTLRLALAGYRLRFAEDAVAAYEVPETRAGYLKQHARWARGYNDVARAHTPALLRAPLPPLLRFELLMFVLGYLDRIALLAATALGALSLLSPRRFPFPRRVLCAALVAPFAQIVLLFVEQRVPFAFWVRLPLVPLFFALDIFAAARALLDSLLGRQRVWSHTPRAAPRDTLPR